MATRKFLATFTRPVERSVAFIELAGAELDTAVAPAVAELTEKYFRGSHADEFFFDKSARVILKRIVPQLAGTNEFDAETRADAAEFATVFAAQHYPTSWGVYAIVEPSEEPPAP